MKKFTHRLLPLVLCFTLTLGAFVYRPPTAKAVAVVDDAVVIGALLTVFSAGCGLIFSNNGMTSSEIASAMTTKWNEYKETLSDTVSSFSAWLGYDDMDALITDLRWDSVKECLEIPVAMAQKFKKFADWFVVDADLTDDGVSKEIFNLGSTLTLADGSTIYVSTSADEATLLSAGESFVFDTGSLRFVQANEKSWRFYWGSACLWSYGVSYSGMTCSGFIGSVNSAGEVVLGFRLQDSSGKLSVFRTPVIANTEFKQSPKVTDFSAALSPSAGVQTPDLSDEKDTAVGITGVGDGTATTIEDLLQKILDQTQANTLAPTLDIAGTETGDNTGTDEDEDSKPYLPYIPRIFEKVKELPAAIAEKIGAFFTTLWGWLSDIITEIKALPAAIAEKVGELFTPDEALVTEITDTFKGKFSFFSTLKQFADDLFGMTPTTDPPVIWVHLENAESKYGYVYGDKQKILDFAWYQKYKPTVDGLLSGFLWLGYLWLLFKRAPAILNGMAMDGGLLPPLQTGGDAIDAPRIGSGDPSIHYGDGFTFRDKGGKRK